MKLCSYVRINVYLPHTDNLISTLQSQTTFQELLVICPNAGEHFQMAFSLAVLFMQESGHLARNACVYFRPADIDVCNTFKNELCFLFNAHGRETNGQMKRKEKETS